MRAQHRHNENRSREERVGPKARVTPKNLESFNKCIEASSLNDLQEIGEEISWHNMRTRENMIESKIDRAFVNHALLIVEIRKIKDQTKPFWFINSWLHCRIRIRN